METINKLIRIVIEQDADPMLPNFNKQCLSLSFDEQILATNPRYTLYSRSKQSIIIKDDNLDRQNYNDVGEISHLQLFLPVQSK